jgi:hypothetical protein
MVDFSYCSNRKLLAIVGASSNPTCPMSFRRLAFSEFSYYPKDLPHDEKLPSREFLKSVAIFGQKAKTETITAVIGQPRRSSKLLINDCR